MILCTQFHAHRSIEEAKSCDEPFVPVTANGGEKIAETIRFAPLPPPMIDEQGIATLEEILAGAKAGTVTAFAIVAKDAGFATWQCVKAYRNADRFNLMGQLVSAMNRLDRLESESDGEL